MTPAETQQLADVGGLAAAVLAEPQPVQEAIDYAIEIERLDCTLRFDEVIRSHLRSGRLKMRRRA